MARFTNLTAHTVNVVDEEGILQSFDPSGKVARIHQYNERVESRGGFICNKVKYAEIEEIGEVMPDHYYIVSNITLARFGNRTDVVAPDTGPSCIKNPNGSVRYSMGFLVNQ
jgi:hypothetical protein